MPDPNAPSEPTKTDLQNLEALKWQLLPLLSLEAREMRQHLRDFRSNLRDAFVDELQCLLRQFVRVEAELTTPGFKRVAMAFCDVIEEELDARVNESTWAQGTRLARRGAQTTKAWLKTDQGKEAATVVGIVAAALGFSLWG